MSCKIKKIYEDLIKSIEEDEIEIALKKEVLDILQNKPGECQSLNEKENVDIAFKIAEAGEEAGFVRGFQYAVQLMTECK